jgi:hypothetical protein
MNNSDVEKVLREARSLIDNPNQWGQGNYRTVEGRRCAIRALCDAAVLLDEKAAGNRAVDLLDAVARRHGHITSERMNDQSTHAEMLAAFDEAIVAARQRTGVALQTSITCTSHSS